MDDKYKIAIEELQPGDLYYMHSILGPGHREEVRLLIYRTATHYAYLTSRGDYRTYGCGNSNHTKKLYVKLLMSRTIFDLVPGDLFTWEKVTYRDQFGTMIYTVLFRTESLFGYLARSNLHVRTIDNDELYWSNMTCNIMSRFNDERLRQT